MISIVDSALRWTRRHVKQCNTWLKLFSTWGNNSPRNAIKIAPAAVSLPYFCFRNKQPSLTDTESYYEVGFYFSSNKEGNEFKVLQ